MKRLAFRNGLTLFAAILAALFILSNNVVFAQQGLKKIADGIYAYADVKNGSPKNSFGANAGIVVDRG